MRQTFSVEGYKLLVHQPKKQQISITATSSLTDQVFSVHNYPLVNITAMTIWTAFRQTSPSLKCNTSLHLDTFTRHEKHLLLTITINLEYLPTIQESIILPLLEGKSANKLAQINDIKEQLHIVQHQLENTQKNKTLSIGKLDTILPGKYQYSQKLEAGVYLIEISGTTACEPLIYNEQMDYDDNYMSLSANLLLKIETYFQEKAVETTIIEKGISGTGGYETMFSATKLVKLQQTGSVLINAVSTTHKLTINESIIFIRPATLCNP